MYRTLTFNSVFENEREFGEGEDPSAPGALGLAEAIVAAMRDRVFSISDIQQYKFYGWAFEATLDRSSFFNVLNPAGAQCYLGVVMGGYGLKALLLQRPRRSFDHYCDVLTDALGSIPEVSAVKWQPYKR